MVDRDAPKLTSPAGMDDEQSMADTSNGEAAFHKQSTNSHSMKPYEFLYSQSYDGFSSVKIICLLHPAQFSCATLRRPRPS
jgi:hypothetical protein